MESTRQSSSIVSHSPQEPFRIAADLVQTLKPGTVLALHGELGAGKTCFVQGLARALGIHRAVNSPTFTLINEYRGTLPLHHVDLYRIRSAEEALGLGLDDYLHGDGITAIEWAERIQPLLPAGTIHIRMEAGATPNDRIIAIKRGEKP